MSLARCPKDCTSCAFGMSLLGQRLTKYTEASIAGHQMIKYLRGTQGCEIIYGEPGQGHGVDDVFATARTLNLLDLFADASFCPGSDRSQTGIVMQWGNVPIGWLSLRQSTTSLSTAEAELGASIDAMVLGGSVLPVLAELSGSTCLHRQCRGVQLPHNAQRKLANNTPPKVKSSMVRPESRRLTLPGIPHSRGAHAW